MWAYVVFFRLEIGITGIDRYKGHSTNHAVITLVERVAKALDTGKIVVGVYLDIRKAFDAIDHPILLRKLYSLGIRGNLYTWRVI